MLSTQDQMQDGDQGELTEWLRARIAARLGCGRGAVGLSTSFRDLGMDSQTVVSLSRELSEKIGRALPVGFAFAHPTIRSMIRAVDGSAARVAEPFPSEVAVDEPVAIVGMGCRFPGDVNGPAALWAALEAGFDAIDEVPAARWDVDAYYDADPAVPGRMCTRRGGFLREIDHFDPRLFAISPREAGEMDPQQRLLLEVVWQSLEDAHVPPRSLEGTATGVYVGSVWNDYQRLDSSGGLSYGPHTATGRTETSLLSARVSYVLGLRGPSLTISSACSSSLVAVATACEALRTGDCSLAIAGGVNLMLTPDVSVAISKLGALSPDGRCRPFGAGANGYVRAEGVATVVLKPLSRAVADRDRIYAVIRGAAVNNDGASNGLTAPNPDAQADVLRKAWLRAGIAPARVDYVETHGTGTPLGDPIEAEALGRVFGPGRAQPLRIGSIKGNTGHLEGAAGVAGLMKTALSLWRGSLPPSLHAEELNPLIDFEGLGLTLQRSLSDWPESNHARAAGVSSFGWGGTNCHLAMTAMPRARVVFVCPGQGGQWFGMGRALIAAEPVFADAIEQCDALVRAFEGWSILATLNDDDARHRYDRTEYVQPLLLAYQVGLARLWRARGVEPAAVIGKSVGEVAAAHLAGALSLEDSVRIACSGSRLARAVGAGRGAMAAIGASAELLSGELPASGVEIGGLMAPDTTIVTGDIMAIESFVGEQRVRGRWAKRIDVDHSSHSSHMDALALQLEGEIGRVAARAPTVRLWSNVHRRWAAVEDFTADYWARNLRLPIRFMEGVRACIALGDAVFLELGPHPVALEAILANGARVAIASCSRDNDGQASLDEAAQQLRAAGVELPSPAVNEARSEILLVSGHNEAALRDQARRLADHLGTESLDLSAVVHAAALGRSHLEHRAACIVDSRDQARDALRAVSSGRSHPAVVAAEVRAVSSGVVFVFPGQGAQWSGMARALLAEPAFREALHRCDEAVRAQTGWSVIERVESSPESWGVDDTQPLLFAMAVSLAEQWRAWGVKPSAVIGHSQGEIAAGVIAGGLSLADGARIVCVRSRHLRRVVGQGAMALIEASEDEVAEELRRAPGVGIAAVNGAGSTVVSGDSPSIDRWLAEWTKRGRFCRRVNVDYASHSAYMDPILSDIERELSGLDCRDPRVPMQSTVTANRIAGAELDAGYWCRNLRQPVRFGDALQALVAEGHDAFVEVSPHPLLTAAIERGLARAGRSGGVVGSLRRDDGGRDAMLRSLGELHVRGVPVELSRLFGETDREWIDLPTYSFQRQRCWLPGMAAQKPAAISEHPLLGAARGSSLRPDDRIWEQQLGTQSPAFLADHRVLGAALMPAAGFLEMALSATRSALRSSSLDLSDVVFPAALALSDDQLVSVQTAVACEASAARFQIASGDMTTGFTIHARGSVAAARPGGEPHVGAPCSTDAGLEAGELYERLARSGIGYGPAFRGLTSISPGEDGVFARVRLPEAAGTHAGYTVHPALLDACMQLFFAVGDPVSEVWVPVEAERVVLVGGDLGREVDASVRIRASGAGALVGDLTVRAVHGEARLRIEGLRLEKLADAGQQGLLEIGWTTAPFADARVAPGRWLLIADRGGVVDGLATALEAGGASVRVAPARDLVSRDAARTLLDDWLETGARDQHVVHAGALDAGDHDESGSLCEEGWQSGVWLTQRLAEIAAPQPRLWLLTEHAFSFGGESIRASQRAMWGLGGTVVAELPGLRCVRIDVSGQTAVGPLARELRGADSEDMVALRGERRYVARLRRPAARLPRPTRPKAAATYLVTGGLGAMGLALAVELAERGAGRMVLLGRRGVHTDRQREVLDQVRAAGSEVMVLASDIADRDSAVKAVACATADPERPLRGVVHAAGCLRDATLANQSIAAFEEVLAGKVRGAMHLHDLTRDLPLDFFVVYSSAASMLGLPGQANYACANALLDGLASRRRQLGLPALSISWGLVGDAGLGARADRGGRLEVGGFVPMSTGETSARLLGAVGLNAEIGIIPLDLDRLSAAQPALIARPFWAELAGHVEDGHVAELLDALRELEPDERRALLATRVGAQIRDVLRLGDEGLGRRVPLASLGLDSLMSLELRNRLERMLDLRLDAALVWNYPTLEDVVEHLDETLFAIDAPGPREDDEGAELKQIEALDEDERRAAIAAELDEIEELLS